MKDKVILWGIMLLISANVISQTSEKIIVNLDKPVSKIAPTMWGIFFEDINFAADGGLYAELVKNRSFEFKKPLMGWKINEKYKADIQIINRGATFKANPRIAKIALSDNQPVTIENEGFRGMGFKKGLDYNFSILAKTEKDSQIKIKLELLDTLDNLLGEKVLELTSGDWKKYTTTINSSASTKQGKLRLKFEGKGSVEMDMISLFPTDTWKSRKGGLRADLVELLAGLKPGFFRFPGGCIVEGRDLSQRYQWKKTVGKVEERTMIVNRWNTEFSHRLTPDYFQSFGIGFYEYFLLAEELGAEPLPILNCGMACQFNTSELVAMDELNPYIQDALDLIEFANGKTDSKWGKVRAEMGHPKPFDLKMIGIGNEQWGAQYFERYEVFAQAIKKAHPEIKIISGTGPSPNGENFDYASARLKELKAEIVDEHYYASPEWFLENASRYDNYDRNSYKIFAGEYAAQSKAICSPENTNNWFTALSEAAFMTGLERNAEVVNLCSYAPLMAHVEGWQWTPDLIWFDNLNSYGTANYYVQKLYSNNKGTHVLAMQQNNKPLTGQNGIYGTAALDKNEKVIILKLVNSTNKAKGLPVQLKSKQKLNKKAKIITLRSDNLKAVNSIEKPKEIYPTESEITIKGSKLNLELKPYSLVVVRIGYY